MRERARPRHGLRAALRQPHRCVGRGAAGAAILAYRRRASADSKDRASELPTVPAGTQGPSILAPRAPWADPGRVLALLALLLALGARPASLQDSPGLTGLRPEPAVELTLGLLDDVSARGLAFVELDSARDTYLVGEPFTLTLRFGLELEFERASAVQPFQRALDVPVQLHAPWLELLPGAEALGELEPPRGPTVALGERVLACAAAGERQIAGKNYRVFELTRRFAATQSGALELAAPLLRLAYATRFEEDFTSGRRAVDRHDGLVRGAARTLRIQAPPEEGRPAGFSGAIGSFTLEAAASPQELVLGQELSLTLTIAGRGDLSQCEPPELEHLDGFHVRGRLVERAAGRLIARYDLAPERSDVNAIPALEFVYFDPSPPAAYRRATSRAVPLTVRKPERPVEDLRAPSTTVPVQLPGSLAVVLLLALVLLGGLVWLVYHLRRS